MTNSGLTMRPPVLRRPEVGDYPSRRGSYPGRTRQEHEINPGGHLTIGRPKRPPLIYIRRLPARGRGKARVMITIGDRDIELDLDEIRKAVENRRRGDGCPSPGRPDAADRLQTAAGAGHYRRTEQLSFDDIIA